MKKFFISFLATLAGIWFSLLLAVIGLVIVIAAAAVSSGGQKSVTIKDNSILTVDLSGPIYERQPKINYKNLILNRDTDYQLISDITGSIEAAATDDHIDGIVLNCEGASAGISNRSAIVESLRKFKEKAPDKWIYAYGDFYTQGDYYVASVADSIFINPIGMVELTGLASTTYYLKNLCDKLGIDVQVVKVGTYKSAVEPYIRETMSEPAREQQELYLNNIWQNLSSVIAEGRGVDVQKVNDWANNLVAVQATEAYLPEKIVDGLLYRHEFDQRLADLTGQDKVKNLRTVSTADYATTIDNSKVGNGKGANIAVLYACGEIVDNGDDDISSSAMVPEILDLAENEDIDALVMYVNSPGGSAYASEQIWEALQQFKKISGKPFYVSMADYAASGGYYISCGADKIFAHPTTLTGSIGIFGIIPNYEHLVKDKVGINYVTVATNPDALLPDGSKPMTPRQANAMQAYVERGYDLFTKRCAEGRHISQDSIKAIAEGRVWDGSEAIKLGLVDQLGGLNDAIAAIASELNVESYTISTFPSVKSKWYEQIIEAAGTDIKASFLRSELGEAASIYETVRQIKGMAPIQCRMEFTELRF